MIKSIKKIAWIKNWSSNWQMPFASLYWLYTTDLKRYIGKNLPKSLIVCEKDSSSNFIEKTDLDRYCIFIAKQVVKDNSLANKWAEATIATAQELFDTIARMKVKKDLTLVNLLSLKGQFYVHIPPHFSMKKVVDFLPARLQKKLSPKLIEARVKTENLFNEVDATLRKYTAKIAVQTKNDHANTAFMTIEEIESYLKESKIPSQNELYKRSQGTAILYKGTNCTLYTGTSYKQLQDVLINHLAEALKGMVAFKGCVRGRVRIVFDPFKTKDFKRGDVLVTGMTRPEFLPLMKKAAAFVTDAGGMLSHAAIVARELKKPCILGTNFATKILKNGDLVEVDANKGIVRIIKRV